MRVYLIFIASPFVEVSLVERTGDSQTIAYIERSQWECPKRDRWGTFPNFYTDTLREAKELIESWVVEAVVRDMRK